MFFSKGGFPEIQDFHNFKLFLNYVRGAGGHQISNFSQIHKSKLSEGRSKKKIMDVFHFLRHFYFKLGINGALQTKYNKRQGRHYY